MPAVVKMLRKSTPAVTGGDNEFIYPKIPNNVRNASPEYIVASHRHQQTVENLRASSKMKNQQIFSSRKETFLFFFFPSFSFSSSLSSLHSKCVSTHISFASQPRRLWGMLQTARACFLESEKFCRPLDASERERERSRRNEFQKL